MKGKISRQDASSISLAQRGTAANQLNHKIWDDAFNILLQLNI